METKLIHELNGERTVAVVLSAGEEAVSALTEFAKSERLSSAHFTGIGALSRATLGFFEPDRKEYRKIHVGQQVEVVSLVGNVALDDGEPKLHAHIVVSAMDGSVKGGHLFEAHVRPTLEVVFVESPSHLRRTFDKASGLALLDLSR